MKKKYLFSLIATLTVLASCTTTPSTSVSSSSKSNNSQNTSTSSTISNSSSSSSSLSSSSSSSSSSNSSSSTIKPKEKVVQLLSEINLDNIVSYNFIDRSYSYNSYNNSKYIVTGNVSTGLVNYEATHKFKLYNNDVIVDNISVDSLDGVEKTEAVLNTKAKGQIYLKNNYIYDYFICNSMKEQSFVECYETDYYRNLNTYFNYLGIITDIKTAFSDPNSYFPTESGYETPIIEYNIENGIEHYSLTSKFPGTDDYKPVIINFEVDYNTSTNTFTKIKSQNRSMIGSLDTDFEIGTSSITSYTITNIQFGEKDIFNDSLYTFDDIQNKNNIHNAPKYIVDISNLNDGLIDENTAFEIVKNIYAYSNNIRQTNYSMKYHNAFDFATTDRTEFGDAIFEGKIISYANGILDNNGTIQLMDSSDQPIGDKSDFRIFTKAESYGILRGGKFSKYITSAFAFMAKSYITNTREYLDANPLYWNEIASIYNNFETYGLGQTIVNNSKINVSVSGTKSGSSLEIKAQLHSVSSYGTNTENIDAFTFYIEDNKLMSLLFQTTGNTSSGKYTDTYEAKFVHGSKKNFSGDEMNILDEIESQISMDDFNII
ncbi:MAG: hypothetical protein V8Q90_03605 [Bacilli bacterium]